MATTIAMILYSAYIEGSICISAKNFDFLTASTPPMILRPVPTANPRRSKNRIALVLQGGGAMGAYQAGVYQALDENGFCPDWIVGTSIGAINGALIAGNAPSRRLERLKQFWRHVSQAEGVDMVRMSDATRQLHARMSTVGIIMQGVSGFFTPRLSSAFGAGFPVAPEQASFYETSALAATLERLVDFDHLNQADATRLTVNALKVTDGELASFDNSTQTITVDHVLASGALPPAFPPIRIDGQLYWDGGLYSNTPLESILNDQPPVNTLSLSWSTSGALKERSRKHLMKSTHGKKTSCSLPGPRVISTRTGAHMIFSACCSGSTKCCLLHRSATSAPQCCRCLYRKPPCTSCALSIPARTGRWRPKTLISPAARSTGAGAKVTATQSKPFSRRNGWTRSRAIKASWCMSWTARMNERTGSRPARIGKFTTYQGSLAERQRSPLQRATVRLTDFVAAQGRTFTLVCGVIHGCGVSCISIRPKIFSSLCCAQMLRRTVR